MLRDKVVTYEQALALYGKMQFKAELDQEALDLMRTRYPLYFPYASSSKP